jgi:bifunctional non-homologous end joining protein LigD
MPATIEAPVRGEKKSPIPADVMPMLATLANEPPKAGEWLYEVKWDGFRAISYLKNGKAAIRSRNNKVFDKRFYPLHSALEQWKVNAVVDGEIVVVDENGLPDFSALQTWRSEADGDLAYYLFDLLWLDGKNLLDVPLAVRKQKLQQIIPDHPIIRLSENFDASGHELLDHINKMDLEGIIAKKADSIYMPGKRSRDWLKIKTEKHQEAVIAGYTKNQNSSKKFSSLLLGIYEDGELQPIAPVGTGFTTKMQEQILEKLKPLITKKSPFRIVPDFNKPTRFRPDPVPAEITWVKPEMVAEISYRTVSPDGSFRHPSFRGLREDKNAAAVVREEPLQAPRSKKGESTLLKKKIISRPGKRDRQTLLNPVDETQVRNIGGHELKFTNLSKLFWPKDNISKRDMLNFYYQVAPYIIPYLDERPQTLNRFPNGIEQESFYQKDVTGKIPDWIKTFGYYSEADKRQKQFVVCTDEASLLYIANLGCIEMNPWSSRAQSPDHPDWCIIDLDPDKNTFSQVIEAAQVTKQVLEAIDVPCWCKTSGSTGLHIYVPLGAKYSYEDSKEFARAIAKIVHAQIPGYTSIERLTAKRKGKMYIDFLQNRPQATVAGPYSLRPKPGASVSMPLHWEEVKKGLKISDFNIHNSIYRLKEQGDIFKGVLGRGINMQAALKKIKSVFGI